MSLRFHALLSCMTVLMGGMSIAGTVLFPIAVFAEDDSDDDSDEEDWGEESDEDWGDDSGDEFSFGDGIDTEAIKADLEARVSQNYSLSLDGFIRSDMGLWVERIESNPLAKARQSIDLKFAWRYEWISVKAGGHFEYDAAYAYAKELYSAEDIDAYELLVMPRELNVSLELGRFDVTLGRQIVTWGEGDVLSPVDVVNPRDQREPGLADLDDIRVPVLATRIGYFFNKQRFEFIVVHEPDYGFRPPPLGTFSALPAVLQSGSVRFDLDSIQELKTFQYADDPSDMGAGTQQFFFRWQYKGAGLDLALHLASVLYREGVMIVPSSAELLDPTISEVEIGFEHPRYTMAGVSGAVPVGSFIVKWEAAVEVQKPVTVTRGDSASIEIGAEPTDIGTMMLGLTYSGINDTTLAVELQKSYALAAPEDVSFDPNMPVIALRTSHSFLKEDLKANFAASVFGWQAEYGWLARGDVSYSVVQGLSVAVGYMSYSPGDELGPIAGYDRHDRAFLRLRWDFSVL